MGKVIIFSAPSGSGKSTIVGELLKVYKQLEFSISATSREPRGAEVNGREYYFFTAAEFQRRVDNAEFLEHEEVYPGTSYGTLRSEVERIWSKENVVVFDIDVVGGVNLKRLFGDNAISIFIKPPSIQELSKRLTSRATDSPEAIQRRLAKATTELEFAPKFDYVVVNDQLTEAVCHIRSIVDEFIK